MIAASFIGSVTPEAINKFCASSSMPEPVTLSPAMLLALALLGGHSLEDTCFSGAGPSVLALRAQGSCAGIIPTILLAARDTELQSLVLVSYVVSS